MATQEQLDLRKQWIDALRSGEYKQTTGYLNVGDCYCCLGVLCEIAGVEKKVSESVFLHKEDGEVSLEELGDLEKYEEGELTPITKFDGESGVLSWNIREKIGMIDEDGSFGYYPDVEVPEHCSLVDMNDRGKTFEEIADFIEQNPTMIFKD